MYKLIKVLLITDCCSYSFVSNLDEMKSKNTETNCKVNDFIEEWEEVFKNEIESGQMND